MRPCIFFQVKVCFQLGIEKLKKGLSGRWGGGGGGGGGVGGDRREGGERGE